MKHFFATTFIVLLSSLSAQVPGNESEMPWTYAEFVHALRGQDFSHLETLATDLTKCGFGPGQEGKGCIGRLMESDQSCRAEVLSAVNQGCAMVGDNECIAPPQAADDNILYTGPRIHLSFAESSDAMTVTSLICGGD